jgi:hypothetical protein
MDYTFTADGATVAELLRRHRYAVQGLIALLLVAGVAGMVYALFGLARLAAQGTPPPAAPARPREQPAARRRVMSKTTKSGKTYRAIEECD